MKTQKEQNLFPIFMLNRLNRRANAKGITLSQTTLQHNVKLLSIRYRYDYGITGQWTAKTYSGPELEKISLADVSKTERYTLKFLLDNVDRNIVDGPTWDVYWYERTGIIKHASVGYGADILYEANYRAICEEFKDLFAYGILEEKDQSITVYLDRKHHDPDRMQELYDLLHKLDGYPVVDEDLYSQMEHEAQGEFIQSEIRDFIRNLDISPDYEFLFDNDLITTDTLTSHIWQLIRDNNLEFEMTDSAWVDIEKIAKLSPLYQLGYSETHKIDEVIAKVETTAILRPSISNVLSGLLADLESIAYNNKPASDQLSYV